MGGLSAVLGRAKHAQTDPSAVHHLPSRWGEGKQRRGGQGRRRQPHESALAEAGSPPTGVHVDDDDAACEAGEAYVGTARPLALAGPLGGAGCCSATSRPPRPRLASPCGACSAGLGRKIRNRNRKDAGTWRGQERGISHPGLRRCRDVPRLTTPSGRDAGPIRTSPRVPAVGSSHPAPKAIRSPNRRARRKSAGCCTGVCSTRLSRRPPWLPMPAEVARPPRASPSLAVPSLRAAPSDRLQPHCQGGAFWRPLLFPLKTKAHGSIRSGTSTHTQRSSAPLPRSHSLACLRPSGLSRPCRPGVDMLLAGPRRGIFRRLRQRPPRGASGRGVWWPPAPITTNSIAQSVQCARRSKHSASGVLPGTGLTSSFTVSHAFPSPCHGRLGRTGHILVPFVSRVEGPRRPGGGRHCGDATHWLRRPPSTPQQLVSDPNSGPS